MAKIKFHIQHIALLSILMINGLYAQHEWAPIGSKWYYSLPDQYGNPFANVLIFQSIRDTLINSKQFKIIRSKTDIYLFHQSNDRIYYLFKDQLYLAYNFGCTPNDTIIIDFIASLPNPNNPLENIDSIIHVNVIVDSIDLIFNNSKELKKIYCSIIQDTCFPELVWPSDYIFTERIGNEENLIPILFQPRIPEKALQFRCYEDSVISYKSIFWELQSKPCDYIEISGIAQIENNYHIYPNPVSNWLCIESGFDGNPLDKYLQIISSDGKLILQKKLKNKSIIIDISNYYEGVYFIKLINQDQVSIFKILKL